MPRDREQQVLEVSTLWGNVANPLISPERALDVLDVPEDERGDELARLQKIREEANELERDMMQMEMEMKEREFALKAKELELEMSIKSSSWRSTAAKRTRPTLPPNENHRSRHP